MKQWQTLESIAAKDYFQGITKSNRWLSTGKLDKQTFEGKPEKTRSSDLSLKCGVCQQNYDRPKLLHCLHSFCKNCVESLVKEPDVQSQMYVECPICLTKSEIPKNTLDDLPTNVLIAAESQTILQRESRPSTIETNESEQNETKAEKLNEKTQITCTNCDEKSLATGNCEECAEALCDGCTDAHRRVRVARNHHITPLSFLAQTDAQDNLSSSNSCPKHSSELMEYFCLSCDAAVCRQCTETEHCQPDHSFKPLREVTLQQKRALALLVDNLKQKLPFLKRTLLEVEDANLSIPQHVEAITEQIKNSTSRYIRALREREEQLLGDLDAMREYKVTVLTQQKEKVSQNIETIETACAFTGKFLKEGQNRDIVYLKRFLFERLTHMDSAYIHIEPEEGPEFDYLTEEDLLLEMITRTGKIESSVDISAARAMGEGLYNATIGKTSSFTLAAGHPGEVSKEDLEIRIETPDGIILENHVTDYENGLFSASYTPKVYGVHEISIFSCGKHVADSPFTVIAKKGHMSFARSKNPVCLRVSSKGEEQGELNSPSDVAVCSNGRILVADTKNHRIQIFDHRGKFIREFGSYGRELGRFNAPSGVRIAHDGRILVTDLANDRLQVFSSRGLFLKSMSCCGADSNLKGPRGVTTDEEGQILVVDQQNHRVVVYSPEGEFIHEFGSLGTGNGQFNNPMYIALNEEGDIYVTDSCNHRVQVFDLNGSFVKKFGRPGTGEGEFHYPSGITIDSSGYVFVSDRSNRVQVFNQHLRYVTKFGGKQSGDGQLNGPLGLDFTPEGRVAVADSANNCVKIFYFQSEQF